MTITWILVAHGVSGKILEVKKKNQGILVKQEFAHPQTAMKDSEIHSDRPGRTFQRTGNLRHAIDPGTAPKDHERQVFAKEIANYLGKAFNDHKFTELIMVASPDLLGDLRKELPHNVSTVVAHELSKDLLTLGLTDKELVETIRDDLDLVHL